MTIEEQAKNLERSLHILEGMKKKPWMSADEKRAVAATLKDCIPEAERTLRLPATPDTAQPRRQLILWHELGRGTLKLPEIQ
jgi:hypothetical protein